MAESIATDASQIDIWPTCPQCGARRLAVCPLCHTAGVDFPPADVNYFDGADQEGDEKETGARGEQGAPRLALICSTCDEPWEPGFLNRCEWCGHQFGDGVDADRTPIVRELPELAELAGLGEGEWNARAGVLVVALVVAVVGALGYFAWLVGE